MLDFNAGKYAPYVWPAYAITAAVLGLMITESLARARRWRRALEHIQKAQMHKGGDA
jgi:heme exporter protein D